MTVEDWRQPEQFYETAIGPDALTEAQDIVRMANILVGKRNIELERLKKIDTWYKGTQEPYTVKHPTDELSGLLELSRTPWLGLVVTTVAQALFVDGYRTDSKKNTESVDRVWETWLANGMNARQIPIHRAALGYGYAYAAVELGTDPRNGESRAVIRGMSPKRAYAMYRDPSWDEWPLYAIAVEPGADGSSLVTLWDDTFRHTIAQNNSDSKVLSSTPHNAGVVPVVRYTNMLDLEGATPGEIEPFIPLAQRVDKTSFDRLLAQHYNSWKKMWISGLKKPNTDDNARVERMRLRQDDILVAEDPDTKFGTIEQTDISGFISAVASDVEHLSAMSQLPNHLMTGKLVNLSADAIVAANKPLTQKVYERQVTFGQSHNQVLRLAAHLEGNEEGASELGAHVTWQDMEVRSLAQAADALGKLATQLGIPRKALWRLVPGITKQDTDEWEEMLLDDDPESAFLREMDEKKAAAGGLDDVDGEKPANGPNAPKSNEANKKPKEKAAA